MDAPIINGIPMKCYHPNRGWSIDLFDDIIIGYVELIPNQNKTAVMLRCDLNNQDIVQVYIDGLNPQNGANKIKDLIWQASNGKLELVKD